MNDYDLNVVREQFCRLFVLATNNKMNLTSFTEMLVRSEFCLAIERNVYNEIFNQRIEDQFFRITGYKINEDTSYGIYNDAFWAGKCYFDLHYILNKSFSFLFLKLSLEQLLNIYPIYHEMDISSLVEYFKKIDEEKTILRLLCEKKRCSLNDISKETGVPLSTLKKYNSSDSLLYKGSFQTILKLIKYFDVTYYLFVD